VPNRAVEKAFHTHMLARLRLNPWLKGYARESGCSELGRRG